MDRHETGSMDTVQEEIRLDERMDAWKGPADEKSVKKFQILQQCCNLEPSWRVLAVETNLEK
jgi:hypothetical protein